MNLSVIIPAYNEKQRLPRTLDALYVFFDSGRSGKEIALSEIVIVDDGSTDGTLAVAEAWNGRLPLRYIRFPHNRGKGAALRAGVLAARGSHLLLYDADAATPIGEVERLWEALRREGTDIAIGSRVLGNPQSIVMIQWHRRFIGYLYHALTAPLVPGIADAACGCKLLRREVAQHLFSVQTIDRFAYDIEVLSLARHCGYNIVEVPVAWKAVPVSKVRLLRDGLEMLWRVICLYCRRFTSAARADPCARS